MMVEIEMNGRIMWMSVMMRVRELMVRVMVRVMERMRGRMMFGIRSEIASSCCCVLLLHVSRSWLFRSPVSSVPGIQLVVEVVEVVVAVVVVAAVVVGGTPLQGCSE